MKDEIKEINIKIPGQILDYVDTKEHLLELFNYITNLQKENEILRKNAEHNDKVVDKARWNEMIYKSRNEKAIEYIHNHQPVFELSNKEQIQEWFEKEYYVELLNILQGDDKDE